MAILIDGYNLLHAAGIIPRGIGAGTLQRARNALLNWLVSTLEPKQLADTIVVFDAANPPPGLPREVNHQGLTVMYSTDHENADAMLEELIRKAAVPKRLVVVSSDHRVQRAAKRRRSTAIDSDTWYFELQSHRNRAAMELPPEHKPAAPLSANEVQQWLDEFGELSDSLDPLDAEPRYPARIGSASNDSAGNDSSRGDEPGANPGTSAAQPELPKEDPVGDDGGGIEEGHDADLANPFPPGYGEDLLKPDANLDE